MNHGCVTYSEAGRTKIMVAGGVTSISSPGGEAVVTTSVEVMDWQTRTWTTARALPRRLTGDVTSDGMSRSNIKQSGIKMIKTQNRPTILGQYNFEKQNIVLRYDIKYMSFILCLLTSTSTLKIHLWESALGNTGDQAACWRQE